jgi:hypothetical protein
MLPNVPQDEKMPEAVRAWLERLKREIEAALSSIDGIVIPTKASSADAVAGTDDEKFLTSVGGVAAVKTHSPFLKFAYFEDRKTANTNGGSRSSGGYVTRTLNTTGYNGITGASLSSNQVTLPAGTYIAEGSCPAYRVGVHKCRLYDVTATAVLAYGTSTVAGAADLVQSVSTVFTRFTIASSSAIRLEHSLDTTTSSADYGLAANLTGEEVYSTLRFWKLD